MEDELDYPQPKDYTLTWAIIIMSIILIICLFSGCAQAYNIEQLEVAIKRAENSHNHPYGILAKYKHTSPKQACINTIRHNFRNYSNLPYKTRQAVPFIVYLQRHYAPIGCNTDNGKNRFWVRNVVYWLRKGG